MLHVTSIGLRIRTCKGSLWLTVLDLHAQTHGRMLSRRPGAGSSASSRGGRLSWTKRRIRTSGPLVARQRDKAALVVREVQLQDYVLPLHNVDVLPRDRHVHIRAEQVSERRTGVDQAVCRVNPELGENSFVVGE